MCAHVAPRVRICSSRSAIAARNASVSRTAARSIPVASAIASTKLTRRHVPAKSISPEYPIAAAAARTSSSRRTATPS